MFWKREREFDFQYEGPCMYCANRLVLIMPWFRGKKVEVKCAACHGNQEVYPNRKIIKGE